MITEKHGDGSVSIDTDADLPAIINVDVDMMVM